MIILSEDKNIMSLLSEHDAHQVLLALFSEPDDIPELSPLANMAYTAVKSKSDRISERKSKAGKLGGSAHKDQSAKEQAEASRTSRTSRSKQNKQEQAEQAEQAEGGKTSYRTVSVSVTDTNTNTPPTPQGGKHAGDFVREKGFSKQVEDKVFEWLQYKKERKENYKETGLKSLLTEIANNIEKHGQLAVIAVISTSMANNWKGIIWEKIQPMNAGPPDSRNSINKNYDESWD